jgi:DNA-directed RNA polymerase specialized sigma24 family protein
MPTSCCARAPETVQAFAELWRRHYRSGLTVASSITSTFDADDLVQEAYARIYQAIARAGADGLVPRVPVHEHPQYGRRVGPRPS